MQNFDAVTTSMITSDQRAEIRMARVLKGRMQAAIGGKFFFSG